MSGALDRRLVFVTGKGGVGKTTVAAALGLAAARRGKRTIICELAAEERLGSLFGVDGSGHAERPLAPGLNGIAIDPERSKQEWLRYQLRSAALAAVLGHSRLFQYLTAAAPGLQELVAVGKVWELAQLQRKTPGAAPYDLVIVDAPATGHGLALLASPRTFAEVARVGPIHRQAGRIDAFLGDPRSTAVVAVALAEEMPVNETLDLERRLAAERGLPLSAVVANALYPERFSAADTERLLAVEPDPRLRTGGRAAVRAALSEHRRARAQRAQLRRLRRGTRAPVLTLPHQLEPNLDALAARLERAL